MNTKRYGRMKEIFIEARDMPADKRSSFLEIKCKNDPYLRKDVQSLLDADEKDDGLLVTGADSYCPDIDMPKTIADYEIISVIGIGGMGIVYKARQKQPKREVALKVLHSGVVSHRILKRFIQEAELLGRLHHPGITQIYEARTFDQGEGGRPFLVMELIDGLPLTEYVKANNLKIKDRLEILIDICDAVEHAHQKGVIHRDLKPGNILVTKDGQPMILDFGIARTTDADIQITTLRTDARQLIGTIPYMSPEQIAGDSSQIDFRSDVYALGVLLYELLSGELPLDLSSKSIPEAARCIRDDEPTRLGSIDKLYRGDLDTITFKSMEKDPARRYQSAAELKEDLERHINAKPIIARPPSTIYQLGKFANRNKGLVAGLSVAILILLTGTVASTLLAIKASNQSEKIAIEAQRLRASNEFLIEMLQAANPEINRLNLQSAKDVRVIDVLDYAAENLASAYKDQPAVEVSVRSTLAEAYKHVGSGKKALAQFAKALDLAKENLGNEHPDTLRLAVKHAKLFTGAGGLKESEKVIREVLPICMEVFGPDSKVSIDCLGVLMSTLFYQFRYEEALEVAEEAYERASISLKEEDIELHAAINDLAHAHLNMGHPERAEELFREALKLRLKTHGEYHPAVCRAKASLAAALRRNGKMDQAIQLLRDVLHEQAQIFGDRASPTAFTMHNLAVCLGKNGEFQEAKTLLKDVIQIYTELGRPDGNSALSAKIELAKIYIQIEDYEKAEVILLSSHEINIRANGSDNEIARLLAQRMTELYQQWGKTEQATVWQRELANMGEKP